MLPESVRYSSAERRINIYARAPYLPRSSQRIWQFTDTEVTALRECIEDLSLTVVSEWLHDDGVAFIVVPQAEPHLAVRHDQRCRTRQGHEECDCITLLRIDNAMLRQALAERQEAQP